MKIQKNVLEREIQRAIDDLNQSLADTISFAIHIEGDVEVQAVVTRDKAKRIGYILVPYKDAVDDQAN